LDNVNLKGEVRVKAKSTETARRLIGMVSFFITLTLIIVTPSACFATSAYWTKAEQTHDFVVGNLLTSYNSYSITPGSSTTYTWYNVSQMDADANMIQQGDTRYASYMNNTYSFMSHLWDTGSKNGGYYAAANISGSGAGGAQYVDDNSLTGVAYLDAYQASSGSQQAAYLASAEAIANWLMNSGQWDTTCGGGFWWSTAKTVKPTQSNGLAMQLFLRLYGITGKSYYSQWATSIKSWLETKMHGSNGLYIWQLSNTCAAQTTNFTYDNAIMIEADLLWASTMSDASYITKAENIATSMNSVLWSTTYKVYQFTSNDAVVNVTWCVWASEALVRLYQADGDSTWLTYAQENIDYMNNHLRDNSNYGYYDQCKLDGSNRSSTFEEVDQAWMERTQGLLSQYR
jgi:uncharacterized protein YyaL (SSP411 family)